MGPMTSSAAGRSSDDDQALIVERLDATATADALDGLVDVLRDVVDGGASVGFLAPLSVPLAQAFWRGVGERVGRGEVALFVARDDRGIAGTVQLHLAMPANQPHRSEIAKLLVHRRARGAGVAGRLMARAEIEAMTLGKTLLVLDTVVGSIADSLYQRLGWTRVGVIPDYALFPDGRLCDSALFYKRLSG